MSYTLRDGKLDVDPEIQIVGTSFSGNSSTIISCAFCSSNLDPLSLSQRQEHCEQHLQQGPSLHIRGTQPSSPLKRFTAAPKKIFQPKGKERQTRTPQHEEDVFWYRTLSVSPPLNYTPGLIPLLKKALWTSHAQGTTRRAALCYERSVHVSRRSWDRSWGCGYRNFLMACTTLMDQTFQPQYVPLLNGPITPGVRNLQIWIEDAWKAGFDRQGAKQLKTLVDSKKWIGTADLWVAFTYRGIPAELVDFDLQHQPRGVDIVIDWIVDYFSPKLNTIKSTNVHDALRGASPIVVTDRMPLILQHDGHSRTVIGYEIAKSGKVTLLIFDPSMVLDKGLRSLALSSWSSTSTSSQPPRCGHSSEDHDNPRKRPPGSPPSIPSPSTKRPRSTFGNMLYLDDDDDDDVRTVDDSPDSQPLEASMSVSGNIGMDKTITRQVLERFRLDKKKLGKKEYQILYFPMTEPLTQNERLIRKTVTSTPLC